MKNKKVISVSISLSLINWINSVCSAVDSKFRNKSHLVEVALNKFKEVK